MSFHALEDSTPSLPITKLKPIPEQLERSFLNRARIAWLKAAFHVVSDDAPRCVYRICPEVCTVVLVGVASLCIGLGKIIAGCKWSGWRI